jgi:hypothetical protein
MGQCLKRRAPHIGLAAVPFPTRNRKNEFEAGSISDVRQRLNLAPFRAQRWATFVNAVPPSALIENNPSLKPLSFDIGLLACMGAIPDKW